MTITEKVAYLKGLADGLAIDTEKSKEGKLIAAIIDILEDMGMSLEDLEESTTALGEELDAVSDDLSDMEEVIFGGVDEDKDFFEVECPECHEPLMIDQDVLEAGVIECPSCHRQFAVSNEEDDCGCGCDHDHGEE